MVIRTKRLTENKSKQKGIFKLPQIAEREREKKTLEINRSWLWMFCSNSFFLPSLFRMWYWVREIFQKQTRAQGQGYSRSLTHRQSVLREVGSGRDVISRFQVCGEGGREKESRRWSGAVSDICKQWNIPTEEFWHATCVFVCPLENWLYKYNTNGVNG